MSVVSPDLGKTEKPITSLWTGANWPKHGQGSDPKKIRTLVGGFTGLEFFGQWVQSSQVKVENTMVPPSISYI